MNTDYRLIPPSDLGKGSKIKLEVCEVEADVYWKVALELFDIIDENNKKNEDTVMIVPYGPLGPYSRLIYLVNKYRLSLKRCWFINMDEYLTPSLEYVDYNDPISFRGGMDRVFYNKIDDELNIPKAQRIFPVPGHEGDILKLIKEKGKLDLCLGGIGITGHIAFNEPPEPGITMTNEEFKELPTRILKLARETITINSFMNAGADMDSIPRDCITVGMKEIWMAKKIRICMPRDWNAAAVRKVLHGPVTCKFPCSLFQEHPDTKAYVSNAAIQQSIIPETRVYNK